MQNRVSGLCRVVSLLVFIYLVRSNQPTCPDISARMMLSWSVSGTKHIAKYARKRFFRSCSWYSIPAFYHRWMTFMPGALKCTNDRIAAEFPLQTCMLKSSQKPSVPFIPLLLTILLDRVIPWDSILNKLRSSWKLHVVFEESLTMHSLEISFSPSSSSRNILKEFRFEHFTSLLYSRYEFLKFNQSSFSLLLSARFINHMVFTPLGSTKELLYQLDTISLFKTF